jgi:hypothetical protein
MPHQLPFDPQPSLPWRVYWWDFTGHHNWIGRRPKRKQPQRHTCDFATREEAEAFVANLRTNEEIVAQIKPTRETKPPQPQAAPLPGASDWPPQRRRMTGPEWPAFSPRREQTGGGGK